MSFTESDVVENVPENIFDNQRKKISKHINDPDNVPESSAQKRQKMIIGFIKMNNKISSTEISELLKFSPKTIKRDFLQLQEKEMIKRIGSERGGHWEIIGR